MLVKEMMAQCACWCASTDQSCIDESIGGLLYRYLTDDLSDVEQTQVEAHLDECRYCQLAMVNWYSISTAAKCLGRDEPERSV